MKMNVEKIISYVAILMIICICVFLVAKFIVRDNITGEEVPIDTSTRM